MNLKFILLLSLGGAQASLPAAREVVKLGGAMMVKNSSLRSIPMIDKVSMLDWVKLDPANPRNYLAFCVMAASAGAVYAVSGDTKSDVQVIDFQRARDTKFVIDCINDSERQIGPDHGEVARFVLNHDFEQGQALAIKKAGGWAKYLKLAVINGNPAGFVFYQSGPGIVGTVEVLAVHSDYRRKGRATKLLEHAISDLQSDGKRQAALSVRSDNDKANSLYRKFGFKSNGKSAWYEGEHVELIELVKDLNK